ncbi:tannase/feruloyl esterase family alpha/beta hydrolase [Piscinibacter sakaiensis]|uniref:tannase/feruloyl esterase family alpha/beta hydrolase n=1 Tax=Piscinibacter sakaiensis TaxID=1547922 RepID=UPI00372D7B67
MAGTPVPAHCRVTGTMFSRTGVNGNYAIGFEARLPAAWNGRFFHQVNGGTDGSVATATGAVNGGGGLTNALKLGFAVVSSDAGHNGAQNAAGTANFGNDPQARLDYGYQAVGKVGPMAKALILAGYGKGPDRSYIGGCSNGGRHTLVAASRYPDQYDGYLVGNAGFNLPKAATANIGGYQRYLTLASTPGDASTGFTAAERTLVSNAVLARCDALDGATDGLVQDTTACQATFDLARDVPTCTGARDGSCLTAAQKTTIAGIFSGVTTSNGTKVYASWPWDNGLQTGGWSFWKFVVPSILDSVAVGQIFQSPPEDAATFVGPVFAATASVDQMVARINATAGAFTESAMSFMTPPNPSDLSQLKGRGAKVMVYHGTADPIFSADDTTAWYEALRRANGGNAGDFARYYRVPGMNHCSGGPATDQFDMLSPLVAWVEQGQVPGAVTASARGAGNAGGVNADLPASWSATRTRPLCPYPQVARYRGTGSLEDAASFSCQ